MWIVPLVPERQRKTADDCSTSAIHFPDAFAPQEKIFSCVLMIAPSAGETDSMVSPIITVGSTVTSRYGRFTPLVVILYHDVSYTRSIAYPFAIVGAKVTLILKNVGRADSITLVYPNAAEVGSRVA